MSWFYEYDLGRILLRRPNVPLYLTIRALHAIIHIRSEYTYRYTTIHGENTGTM